MIGHGRKHVACWLILRRAVKGSFASQKLLHQALAEDSCPRIDEDMYMILVNGNKQDERSGAGQRPLYYPMSNAMPCHGEL
jgi:hypothetical protein